MKFKDKNYEDVYVGAEVQVPQPTKEFDDIWLFEFVGTIKALEENGYVVVEDGDGDCFTIEVERVELV